MTDPAVRARFEDYLARLAAGRARPGRRDRTGRNGLDGRTLAGRRVVGSRLRLDGASPARRTATGTTSRWLPDSERIALSVVEHHGGVKVIYDDGHVLEFGMATLESLQHWFGYAVEVYVDKGGVADAVAGMVAKPLPEGPVDLARTMRLIMTQLLIGVGARATR